VFFLQECVSAFTVIQDHWFW